MMKQVFRDVYVVKPESSRSQSAEAFVVGINFKQESNLAILSESISALKEKKPNLEEVKLSDEVSIQGKKWSRLKKHAM